MYYHDRIYGAAHIAAPVLVALINSRAVQRLHGVAQHGITATLRITSPTTRFEHSLGVMLLAQRLGAGLHEQIAALLHDVSHTAFSHVVDHVFHAPTQQSFHEERKAEYFAQTDLPQLLAQHGYDWRALLDESAFTILEQPAPALCADRLDYFLRDTLDLGLASLEEITSALTHLHVHESGRIIVRDVATARWLAHTYLAADQSSWANLREVGLYELMAQVLRLALELGVIEEADLWRTDAWLWQKLHAANEPTLQQRLRLISPHTQLAWAETQPDFHVRAKLRTIDPHVLHEGELVVLSQVDAEYARRREAYLAERGRPWPVRIVSSV